MYVFLLILSQDVNFLRLLLLKESENMIKIMNCNNIDSGEITVFENQLNIKYGFNGTGKSTISNAIAAKINNDTSTIEKLTPFKYIGDEEHFPSIDGCDVFKSVMIFNEEYINQYVFREDELLKNSFDVFIKTPKYDEHMKTINELLKSIHDTFNDNKSLQNLLSDLQIFADSFGKTQKSYSASSLLGKGLGKGNKLENIPKELEKYTPFLLNKETNVPWLKWQLSGKSYCTDENICPYCANDITDIRNDIETVAENFDYKEIDSLNKMLEIFSNFSQYFSASTQKNIKEIERNISGISEEQKLFLGEIRNQAITFISKLNGLKSLSYTSLSNVDKVSDIINEYGVDISYLSHFDSDFVRNIIYVINTSVEEVKSKIGQLQGQVNQQKCLIKKTIEKYEKEINNFLEYGGYKYRVLLDGNEENYKLKLRHTEYDGIISGNENHLSYGEKNAFALALFMYSALHESPDLIILDDPISSFDGNKKFAIINMLFMGSNSFKNKTVLLLTHEFNIVIDTIYNFKGKILPAPRAQFLSTRNGVLSEKEIEKSNIKSFVEIANKKMEEPIDIINKLIYLRRLLELQGDKGDKWDLISSLLHKRRWPTRNDDIKFSEKEIQKTEMEIKNQYSLDFNYIEQSIRVNDEKTMKTLYKNCTNNYEKLQIFRIIFDKAEINDVVKQFINKTYHVENDFIFQLDPSAYNTVPQYIVNICDEMIDSHIVKSIIC